MKLRLMVLAAGAMLMTGGKTVFGERNFESMPSNGSVYRVEEGYPMRGPNEFRMRETLNERDVHFSEGSFEDHFREMERFHSEWDNLTEEERENWQDRRNESQGRYNSHSFDGYGMMGPRRANVPRHGCGLRR